MTDHMYRVRVGSIFLCLLLQIHVSEDAVIVLPPPPSINVTLANKSVTVSCEAIADTITYLINETSIDQSMTDQGFMLGVVEKYGNISRRELKIRLSREINNTRIMCSAINAFSASGSVKSNLSILIIQGSLDPPIVTNTSPINNTAVYISWTPPPTLDGTVINGYYVTSTTGDSVYTEDNSVTLFITNPDPCHRINISIVAYNGINGTAVEVDNIILPSIPNEVVPVSAVIHNQSQEITNFIIRTNVSKLCPGEYPKSMLINITNSTGSSVFFDTFDLVPSPQSNYMYMDSNSTISLIADQSYNITVTLMNVLGNFESSEISLSLMPTPEMTKGPTIASVDANKNWIPIIISTAIFIVLAGIGLVMSYLLCKLKTENRASAQLKTSSQAKGTDVESISYDQKAQKDGYSEGLSQLVFADKATSQSVSSNSQKSIQDGELQLEHPAAIDQSNGKTNNSQFVLEK